MRTHCWVLLLAACGTDASDTKPSAPSIELASVDQSQDLVVTLNETLSPKTSVLYAWTKDGRPQTDLDSERVPADLLSRGETWRVDVRTVRNGERSQPATAEASIRNAPPQVTAAFSQSSYTTEEDIEVVATTSDLEGDEITLTWEWLKDGAVVDADGPVLSASETGKGQRWTARITPNDSFDDGDVFEAETVIGNTPPTLSSVRIEPSAPVRADTLIAAAEPNDLDGDEVEIRWIWTLNDEIQQDGLNATFEALEVQRDDRISVSGIPNDGKQDGFAYSSEVVTIGNSLPEIQEAALSEELVNQNSVLETRNVVTYDADDDDVTFTTVWHVGDATYTSDIFDLDGVAEGTEVFAELIPWDGRDEGAPFATEIVTVQNTPPRMAAAQIQPRPAYAQSLLDATANVFEPDGDPLSVQYAWSVNDTLTQDGPSPTLASGFARSDEVEVTITVSDGVNEPVVKSDSVVIYNAPPSVEEVSLSADRLAVGDTLTCIPSGVSDPDGDEVTLTIDWYVESFWVGEGESLPSGTFRGGDSVWCGVTPTDGSRSGETVFSDVLMVDNEPPSGAITVIEYEGTHQGVHGLQCSLAEPLPVDPEGDPIVAEAHWEVDGVPYEGEDGWLAGGRIRAADTLLGQEWSCTVEVYNPGSDVSTFGTTDTLTMTPAGGNILFVLMDDVGTDMVGAYEEHPTTPPTPTLDQLADEGILFRNAYSSPVCSPTRANVMTGRHGRRTGIGVIVNWNGYEHALPPSEVLVPEILGDAPAGAYTSALTGKWHLGNRTSGDEHAGDVGFEWYAGAPENLLLRAPLDDGTAHGYFHWIKNINGVMEYSDTYATTDTVDDAIANIESLPEPWFIYVPLNAAHSPVHVPPTDLTTLEVTDEDPETIRFKAVVEAMDTEIGRLLDALSPEVASRTTVVVMGDNGSPDWAITPPRVAPQYKGTMYEGGTNVPLIVRAPFVDEPGRESDTMVHAVDLFSSFIAIGGVQQEGLTRTDLVTEEQVGYALDGISFLPHLADASAPKEREYIYTERFYDNGAGPYEEDKRALRDERWKLMWLKNPDGVLTRRFYDLQDRDVEGDDLLMIPGGLTEEASIAFERLNAEMMRLSTEMAYDVPELPPKVIGIYLSPEAPSSDETISCLYDFAGDPNGDAVTLDYTWSINNIELVSLEGANLPPGIGGTGDLVTCSITPTDGLLVGETVSVSAVLL